MDPFAALEVPPGASAEEIAAAYRRLAKRWHPDRGGGAAAAARMAEINVAYDVLRAGAPPFFEGAGPGARRGNPGPRRRRPPGRARGGLVNEPPLFGRLPEQYFTRILTAVAAARAEPGPPGIDL